MNLRIYNPLTSMAGLCILLLLAISSCKDDDKSENNSTTVEYNQPASGADTAEVSSNTAANSTTVSNNNLNTSGRTTAGGRRVRISAAPAPPPAKSNVKMETDKQGYYNYTETRPSYTGGQQALDNFINTSIEYPQDAIDNNIEGTVYVQFAIDENGRVSNVRTTGTKLGYGLEEAAVQAIAGMPKWTPGQVNGKNVKAWYSLPVTFKIED